MFKEISKSSLKVTLQNIKNTTSFQKLLNYVLRTCGGPQVVYNLYQSSKNVFFVITLKICRQVYNFYTNTKLKEIIKNKTTVKHDYSVFILMKPTLFIYKIKNFNLQVIYYNKKKIVGVRMF